MTSGQYRAVAYVFFVSWAGAQTPARINTAVDDSVRVVLANSMHPLARLELAGDRLDGGLALDRMMLLLDAGADIDAQQRTFIDRLHTPGSPDFHRWLTPEEFGARFGLAASDIQAIRGWLEAQGFRIDSMAKGRRIIQFSGTVRQVEAAFRTEMRHFRVNGEDHIANAAPISIPAALAPAVKGIASLNNFFGHPPDPRLIQSGANYLGPGDFATIYDLNPLYKAGLNGSGERIGLLERTDFNLTDFANYRTVFGLPQTTINLYYSGADPGYPAGTTLNSGDYIEADFDVQQAGGVAPGATIDAIVCGSTWVSAGEQMAAFYAIEQNQEDILNLSYHYCEPDMPGSDAEFMSYLWGQAAAQGITITISAGDNGAADCDSGDPANSLATHGLAVNGYASTLYDTAVGGTQFDESAAGGNSVFWSATNSPTYTSVLGYIPEAVWNEGCNGTVPDSSCPGATVLVAGGGGVSTLYSKPTWQMLSIPGIPQGNARDLPDVSFNARGSSHDGYAFCFNGGCQDTGSPTFLGYGGTSFAAPSFAGIMAIVDQKLGGRQGLANYALYSLAAAENFSNCNSSNRTNPSVAPGAQCPFNDITVGNNGVPGQTGYNAGVGYDLATGLGSVNASLLANLWASLATTLRPTATAFSVSSGSSINITHGESVTVTGIVQPKSGTGSPSGIVAFETDKYGAGFEYGNLGTSGETSFSMDSFPGGKYNLFLSYPGDGVFAGSISNSIPATVNPEASGIAMGITLRSANYVYPWPLSASAPYGAAVAVFGSVYGNSGVGYPSGTGTISTTGLSVTQPLTSFSQFQLNWCSVLTTNCLGAGSYTFTASYSGDNSYTASTATTPVTLTVTKVTPTISWTPAGIAAGVALGATQLNAAATFMAGLPAAATPVTGTFTYNPPAGAKLTAGTQTLSAMFTPSVPGNFNSTAAQVNIDVTGVCDVNQAGAYNVADVQTMVNQALGEAKPANDLNSNRVVNVVDVMIVIDAALNLGCTV